MLNLRKMFVLEKNGRQNWLIVMPEMSDIFKEPFFILLIRDSLSTKTLSRVRPQTCGTRISNLHNYFRCSILLFYH